MKARVLWLLLVGFLPMVLSCHTAVQAEGAGSRMRLPEKDSPNFHRRAAAGINDLIANYWQPDGRGGHVVPTWTGVPLSDMPDKRGAIWERGMMLFALDNYHEATGDRTARRFVILESQRFKALYAPHELEEAGALLHTAVDDCGWNALLYLTFYRYTKDEWWLERTGNLLNSVYARWLDTELGGGLWYRDEHDKAKRIKSLYSAGVVLASLELWQRTGNAEFRDRALGVYEWMESALGRPDGIYFCDCNASGPLGKERPDQIREAGSVSYLSGNMGMAVIHARMYRLTRDEKYLQRAIRTAQGILDRETHDGMYVNDRDAWTNSAFMGSFVREVLTLPGVNPQHKAVLFKTAESIAQNDRTPDGYYGGCWGGPADGPGSKWSSVGSIPRQIMTSATSVNVLVSAAALR